MALSLTKSESFRTASRHTSELLRKSRTRFRAWLRTEFEQAQFLYIQRRAEKGDAANQFRLGLIYESGQYGLRSDCEAQKWFLRAAFQGMAEAQAKVSEYHRQGRSVPRNDKEAFIWCRKAAEQGHVQSQIHLAQMYQNGIGIERNPTEAKKWFSKATQPGPSGKA
jgi:hypothetical protein